MSQERSRSGIVAGLVVLAIAVAFTLPPLGVRNAGAYLFLGIGLAFVVSFVRDRHAGWPYLLPGCVLVGFGVGLLVPTLVPDIDERLQGPILLASQATALAVSYLVRPQHWAALVPAAILAIVSGTDAFLATPVVPDALQPYFLPVVLAGIASYLLRSSARG